MTELCWIVLDDSGSLSSYDNRIRQVHADLRYELESSFHVRTWITSSSSGMGPLTDRHIGSGGGDGMSKMFDELTDMRGRPCFVIYLTDGEANLTPDIINAIRRFHVVLVDITDPRWSDINSTTPLHDFLLHDCEEECDEDCSDSIDSGAQPFYPNWNTQVSWLGTPKAVWATGIVAAMNPNRITSSKVYKHPVDVDLDTMVRALDANKSRDVSVRAQVGVELFGKIKKIIGGNTLTPVQWEYIKKVYYRILVECINMPTDAARKATCNLNTPNSTITEVQEGQPMSHAQITTTVSLKIASSRNATVRDLKTLITEVERVGGTDDSFVNLESAWRNGCLDAVVVVAVDVTEPELDPRVECVLSIEDNDKRRQAMLDLYRDGPSSLRKQIEPFLTVATKEKPAKKATATKPKA